ncbi:GntR family transcriptional regulator [Rhodobium orientis]|uniref:GntR family transcriptional regulator n=1 Tax=Rhodobium orientis TaxID=34017 RepID=UPI001473314E|nr:GntR family transcriptional regulator [Rhodobium orientis]MBB4301097.1 GntR family transcriptional regulator [Rhodobium orientis]
MAETNQAAGSGAGRAVPLYQQIRNHLLELMESGELQPGDKLPSENTLAKQFKTTRATVVSGFQQLVHEGRVVRKAGRGSFVAERMVDAALVSSGVQSIEEQLARQGAVVSYKFLRFDLTRPNEKVRTALALDDDEDVYRLERVRLSDGRPISLEIRHIRRDLGRGITVRALEETAFIDILRRELGLKPDKIVGTLTATAASEKQASLLAIRPGTPLVLREYTFYDGDGQPLTHGESCYRNDVRFQYTSGA